MVSDIVTGSGPDGWATAFHVGPLSFPLTLLSFSCLTTFSHVAAGRQ